MASGFGWLVSARGDVRPESGFYVSWKSEVHLLTTVPCRRPKIMAKKVAKIVMLKPQIKTQNWRGFPGVGTDLESGQRSDSHSN